MKYITTLNGKSFEIDIDKDGNILVNGEKREVDFLPLGPALFNIVMEYRSYELVIEDHDGEYEVLLRGRLYSGDVLDERAQLLRSQRSGPEVDSGEISIKAPMPGLVLAIPVQEGQEVVAGQTVVILESMKMQNELKAPRDGLVARISAQIGASVEQGKLLVTIV